MTDVIAVRAVATIGDVLALCTEHGIDWHHPRWDERSKERVCQARVVLPNKWEISIGFCPTHYCSWRDVEPFSIDLYGETKSLEEWLTSPDAEVAIFRPDGSWYIPEEAHYDPEYPDSTWVGGWWSAERVLHLIVYIGGMGG